MGRVLKWIKSPVKLFRLTERTGKITRNWFGHLNITFIDWESSSSMESAVSVNWVWSGSYLNEGVCCIHSHYQNVVHK